MLSKQVAEARKAAAFAKLIKDDQGRVNSAIVPGHDGKQYRVFMKNRGPVMQVECKLTSTMGDSAICNPNGHGYICYHALAAVIARAADAGFSVAVTKNWGWATKLRRLHRGAVSFVVRSKFSVNMEYDVYVVTWPTRVSAVEGPSDETAKLAATIQQSMLIASDVERIYGLVDDGKMNSIEADAERELYDDREEMRDTETERMLTDLEPCLDT